MKYKELSNEVQEKSSEVWLFKKKKEKKSQSCGAALNAVLKHGKDSTQTDATTFTLHCKVGVLKMMGSA